MGMVPVAEGMPADDAEPPGRLAGSWTGLSPRRRAAGFGLAVAVPAGSTAALLSAGPTVGLAGDALVLLLAVVVTAVVGGLGPALAGALVSSALLNYYFIPPVRTLRVDDQHNIVTLSAFLMAAVLVSAVVHRAESLAARAAQAAAGSRTLTSIAAATIRGQDALPALLEELRTAFGMTSASLLRPDAGGWVTVHSCGVEPAARPDDADVRVSVGPDLVLALTGRSLDAADRTILRASAAHAEGLLERDRLARAAASAQRLAASERLRDALLAALGHDLRTPLASASAAVASLRSPDVSWSSREVEELLATAEESLTRLTRLVVDLLDLSRLRAGVLAVAVEPCWLDDVVGPALDELGAGRDQVDVFLPADSPPALVDPALFTRILVNVVGNALRYAPDSDPILVRVTATDGDVEVRVVDHGPGVPAADRERIFAPFQRLGDTDIRTGVGLGLALSRGLVEAMGGTLSAEDTPGGGLTVVVAVPRADEALPGGPEPGRCERSAPGTTP